MKSLHDLPASWRARALQIREWTSDEGSAKAFEMAAVELEDAVAQMADEPLTLAEAARESGYSERRLRELLTSGEVAQAGRKGAPRIRRRDLPRKAGSSGDHAPGGYDPIADAHSILSKMAS